MVAHELCCHVSPDHAGLFEVTKLACKMLQVHHNRNNMPEVVSKLAGVMPYSAEEVQTDSPLVHMSCEELHSIVEQGA